MHKSTYLFLLVQNLFEVDWQAYILVVDICGVFPDWVEDCGVCVWIGVDGVVVYHNGWQVVEESGGVGGLDLGKDEND
jgi:hypothetical protein